MTRPLNTMQLMALKAIAAEAYVVEVGTRLVRFRGGMREVPGYTIHVMGTTINAQIGSLVNRGFILWRPKALKIDLTNAGKEHLDNLTREVSRDTTVE